MDSRTYPYIGVYSGNGLRIKFTQEGYGTVIYRGSSANPVGYSTWWNEKAFHVEQEDSNVVGELKVGNIIIGTQDANGDVSFSAKPKVHTSFLAAQPEAERIASINPGKNTVVVKVMGVVEVPKPKVTWKK